tara:strand:+ start:417 stop:629 length:213 start_codon:yes stop_codon:yes gene_type:complete
MTYKKRTESFFLTASQDEIMVLVEEVKQLRQDVELLLEKSPKTHSMRNLLENEIIPLLEAEVNYDSTPQY